MEEASRKRPRRRESLQPDDFSTEGTEDSYASIPFPKELDNKFAEAIFELGLKNSSPKLLIPFMPADSSLNTEHIKSHLQKYRIHKQRSKDEFCSFYESYIKKEFDRWETQRDWGLNSMVHINSGTSDEAPESNSLEQANDDLEDSFKELARLQEILQTSTAVVEQWRSLCKDISQHSELLSKELNGLLSK